MDWLINALKTVNPVWVGSIGATATIGWKIIIADRTRHDNKLKEQQEFFKTQLAEDRKEFREALKEVCATFNKEVETCQAERAKMYEQVLKLVRRTADVATH
jgi:hypothetical protein